MKFLITAGPTREKIDSVRFITNYSSGKMGYALTEAACFLNHDVTLISGPTNLKPPDGAHFIPVESASEMYNAVMREHRNCDVIIMVAAVADYTPKKVYDHKLKKTSGNMIIELVRTKDILLELSTKLNPGQKLIGFAAETDNLLEYAKEKLVKKRLDWIITNKIGNKESGFESDKNSVIMLSRDGKRIDLPLMSKKRIAMKILDTLLQ